MHNERLSETGLFHIAEASILNFLLTQSATGEKSGISIHGEELPMYEITNGIQQLCARTIIELAEGKMSEDESPIQCKILETPERRYIAFVVDESLVTEVAGASDIRDPKNILLPLIQEGRVDPQSLILQAYRLYTEEKEK